MFALQGCVSLSGLSDEELHRTRTPGPGWDGPYVWSDGRAALAICRNLNAPRQAAQKAAAVGPVGSCLTLVGQLFDPASLARREGLSSTLSDAALAAAFVDRYGPQRLERLDGDYALARWDPQERRLLLATAPMSSCTLYWYAINGKLWFGSTLALLFRFSGVRREPSLLDIAADASSLTLDPADTVFRGVRQLPQGSQVTMDASGVREGATWRPDPTRRLRLGRDEEYVEAARELLDRAVAVRRSRATTLTGGLDSSTVTATAARLNPSLQIDTYTGVSPPGFSPTPAKGFYADERAPVSAIAGMYPNLRPHYCHSSSPSPLEHDPTPLFVAAGRPVITVGMLGWMEPVYRAACAGGHHTLLMGTAGNFSLSFDGRFCFADLLRAGRVDHIARRLPSVARFRQRRFIDELHAVMATAFPGLGRIRRALRGRRQAPKWLHHSPIRPDFARKIGMFERVEAWGEQDLLPIHADSRTLQAHFFHNSHVLYVELYTTLSAYFGIDIMDPLSDRALAEFCLAIPREQFFLDGRNRSLARRVSADRLPAEILNQPLHGQPNPEWFTRQTALRARFEDELKQLERTPLAAEMLDLPRLKSLVAAWPSDQSAALEKRYDYECLLTRGVHMGHYLRWLEQGNV